MVEIRESVDSLCRDGTKTPISPIVYKDNGSKLPNAAVLDTSVSTNGQQCSQST